MFKLMLAALAASALVGGCLSSLRDIDTPYRHLGVQWEAEDFPVQVSLAGLSAVDGVTRAQSLDAARSAMREWNHALGRQVFVEGSGQGSLGVEKLGDDRHVAYTSHTLEGSRITAFSIVLNGSHAFSIDATQGSFDIETVLAHELGHVLGLDHPTPSALDFLGNYRELLCVLPPASGRLMCPRLAGSVLRRPTTDDVQGAKALYSW